MADFVAALFRYLEPLVVGAYVVLALDRLFAMSLKKFFNVEKLHWGRAVGAFVLVSMAGLIAEGISYLVVESGPHDRVVEEYGFDKASKRALAALCDPDVPKDAFRSLQGVASALEKEILSEASHSYADSRLITVSVVSRGISCSSLALAVLGLAVWGFKHWQAGREKAAITRDDLRAQAGRAGCCGVGLAVVGFAAALSWWGSEIAFHRNQASDTIAVLMMVPSLNKDWPEPKKEGHLPLCSIWSEPKPTGAKLPPNRGGGNVSIDAAAGPANDGGP